MSTSFFFQLPDDIIRTLLISWLSVRHVARLDGACMNRRYRPGFLGILESRDTLLDCTGLRVDAQRMAWIVNRNIHLKGAVELYRATTMEIRSFAWQCSNLQSLDLFSCSSDVTDAALTSIAQGCPSLQSLNLTYCRAVTDVGLTRIAQGCSNLQSLRIKECHKVSDAGLTSITQGCSNLQSLDLAFCRNFSAEALTIIAQGCPNLQSLRLTRCSHVTDAGLTRIAQGCPNLRSLDIIGCDNVEGAVFADLVTFQITDLQVSDLQDAAFYVNVSDAVKSIFRSKCDFELVEGWYEHDDDDDDDDEEEEEDDDDDDDEDDEEEDDDDEDEDDDE